MKNNKENLKANIYFNKIFAGILEKRRDGFYFFYDDDYMKDPSAQEISLTLPLSRKIYYQRKLFSFFKGLLPEGWFLELCSKTLKIDKKNEFEMLVKTCKDCIGAVSVLKEEVFE